MAFKDQLRNARKQKGLTQEQLGSLIGVAKTTINGYERGNSEPDMIKLQKIMDVLRVDANYLLKDEVIHINSQMLVTENDDEESLLSGYRKLNGPGKAKLAEQLADMLSLEKYVSANSDSETAQEITPEITFDTPFQPLTSDAEIEAEVEDYRRQLIEEKELAEKSKALHDVKEA